MKKMVAFFMTVLLVTGLLCATALTVSAEDAAVIRVSGMKEDDTLILSESFTSFEEGWNRAVELADNHEWMEQNEIVRVAVDLYADWSATGGEFGEGDGFDGGAIYLPDGVSMAINMHGHTIDRGLSNDIRDGEVIFMNDHSDLIINGGKQGDPIVEAGKDPGTAKMGTIKGGNSYNGAGGIYMDGKGRLTLNNVCIDGNRVEDDDGSAIAAYDKSLVIINGGSISNNKMHLSRSSSLAHPYGTIYLSDSEATLKEVVISNNTATGVSFCADGLVMYLDDSNATLQNCIVEKNGICSTTESSKPFLCLFEISDDDSALEVIGCRFENNGDESQKQRYDSHNDIFKISDGTLTVSDSYFENNSLNYLIGGYEGTFAVTNCHFINNRARLFADCIDEGSHFTKCTFSGNHADGKNGVFCRVVKFCAEIDFIDCEFIDNPIVDELNKRTNVIDSDAPDGAAGSIFGEGSFSMIVAMLALVASCVSIFLTVIYKKKADSLEERVAKAENKK